MGDRSSTRTYHANSQHHSKSQWSLGWGGDSSSSGSPSNVSSNKFANGSNQNAGNVISERPTTRLHAPPGGRTSDIFGTQVPSSQVQKPQVQERRVEETRRETVTPPPIVDKTNVVAAAPPATSTSPAVEKKVGVISSNAFANGSNQNAGNFITDRPTVSLIFFCYVFITMLTLS